MQLGRRVVSAAWLGCAQAAVAIHARSVTGVGDTACCRDAWNCLTAVSAPTVLRQSLVIGDTCLVLKLVCTPAGTSTAICVRTL